MSSRNWPDVEQRLGKAKQKVRLQLELDEDSISAAVHTHIRHKVGELAEQKDYDHQTGDAVEQNLAYSVANMFLWVALVYQKLEDTQMDVCISSTSTSEWDSGNPMFRNRLWDPCHSLPRRPRRKAASGCEKPGVKAATQTEVQSHHTREFLQGRPSAELRVASLLSGSEASPSFCPVDR